MFFCNAPGRVQVNHVPRKSGSRDALDIGTISSRFNVLNMPVSTTAPIDAKTHV
jgi:hypothetical protein